MDERVKDGALTDRGLLKSLTLCGFGIYLARHRLLAFSLPAMKAKTIPLVAAATVLLAALSPNSSAEMRTFTSTDGKEIKAEIVGVRDGKASLQLEGGKVFDVPLARLTEGDQTFLKAWAEKNKTYKLTDLRLELKKSRKVERKESGKGKDRKTDKTSDITWVGSLQNNTRETIEEILVTYTVYRRDYYRSENGSSDTLEEVKGEAVVGALEGGAKYELESDKVQELSKVVKGNKDSKGTTERQTVLGAVFKVSIDGRELITFEDPRGIVSKVEDEREREAEREEREAERSR